MKTKLAFLFAFTALCATAQTSVVGKASTLTSATNQNLAIVEHIQAVRAACIHDRRCICGKILKILPEGLVIDSGYTNLLRSPINRSWLVPGTVSANRANGLVESRDPGSVCVGQVFVTDLPKSRHLKPKVYDYVIIEGYPAGDYTYTSVGTVHRTVRRFSAVLEKAVDLKLASEAKSQTTSAEIK